MHLFDGDAERWLHPVRVAGKKMIDVDTDAGRLDEHMALMVELLADSPMLIALYDVEDVLRYANPAFRDAFGVCEGEVITFSDMMHQTRDSGLGPRASTNNFPRWLADTLTRRGNKNHRSFEVEMQDGRWFWMTEITNDRGWLLSIASDMTALEHRGSERRAWMDAWAARRAARTDELTGLINRRGIVNALQEAIAGLDGNRRALTAVLIDLDFFKRVNDAHGHDVGDQALRHFARHVLSMVRRSDVVGRYGGEEFLMLLKTDESNAYALLEHARESMPPLPLPAGNGTLQINFSAGLMEIREPEPARLLLKRLDNALYEAKRKGRGRTQTCRQMPIRGVS